MALTLSPRGRGARGPDRRRADAGRGDRTPLHASPRRGEAATREGASAASGGGGGGVGPEVPEGGSVAVRGGAKIGPSSPQGRGARRMAAARPGEVPHLRGEAKGPLRGRGKPLTGHAARGGLSPRGRGARRKGRCAAGEVPHARRSPLRGEANGRCAAGGSPSPAVLRVAASRRADAERGDRERGGEGRRGRTASARMRCARHGRQGIPHTCRRGSHAGVVGAQGPGGALGGGGKVDGVERAQGDVGLAGLKNGVRAFE